MQTGSADLTDALASGSVTWDGPKVDADWDGDGYGAEGSIDDLSGVAGDITVSQVLGDNMPGEVSFSKQASISTAVVAVDSADGTPARRYWSPFNTDSPFYPYERDVAPLRIRHGPITDAGPEQLTLFTGQMADAPIQSGRVAVQAVSATRVKLAGLVQPRPFVVDNPGRAFHRGGNATWVVSWAMAQCGVYASPPARDDCIYWAPMHGSGFPFLPSTVDKNDPEANTGITGGTSTGVGQLMNNDIHGFTGFDGFDESGILPAPPVWVEGPFVLGAEGSADADAHGVTTFSLTDQHWTDGILAILSQSTNRGRVEFWIRGDAANVNAVPGGSGQLGATQLGGFFADDGTNCSVYLGIGVDRKVFITVDDGANVSTFKSTGTLATDGAWYFVGAAWDIADNKLWVNLDGTAEVNTPSPAMTTANLETAATYNGETENCGFTFFMPVAEIQLYKGDGADPALSDWGIDVDFTADAVIYPSAIELVAMIEPQPRQALELITAYAQAEQAATRTDETDRYLYLPRPFWTLEAQQTTSDTINTNKHAGDPDVRRDPTRVRNSVSCRFTETRVDINGGSILDFNAIITLLPGVTRLEISPDLPVVDARTSTLHNLDTTEVSTGVLSELSSGYFAAYSNASASGGTYATQEQVLGQLVYWDAGLLVFEFTNLTGDTYYLLSERDTFGTDLSYLHYHGTPAIQTEGAVQRSVAGSIAVRGVRGLDVTLPQVQTRVDANRIALALVGDTAYPTVVVDQMQVFGDPRRQPGDLVAFSDPKGSGASGTFRSTKVIHRVAGADYTQQVQLRSELPVGVWDETNWDQCVFGAEELT